MFKLEQRNANMFTKVVVTGWVWKNAAWAKRLDGCWRRPMNYVI